MRPAVRKHHRRGDVGEQAPSNAGSGVSTGSAVLEGTPATAVTTVPLFDPAFPLLEILLKATTSHERSWKRVCVSAMLAGVNNGNHQMFVTKAELVSMTVSLCGTVTHTPERIAMQ